MVLLEQSNRLRTPTATLDFYRANDYPDDYTSILNKLDTLMVTQNEEAEGILRFFKSALACLELQENLGDLMNFHDKDIVKSIHTSHFKLLVDGIYRKPRETLMPKAIWVYENGQGVIQDYVQAMNWYQKAAAKGHARARILILAIVLVMSSVGCPLLGASFAKGADVSWLPQMEASCFRFSNSSGVQEDCLQILKENGMNAVRLRVFVNPSSDARSGHCSPAEVVSMAVRAQSLGFRIMIDFHYSDSWADPKQQRKPAAWSKDTFEQLKADVFKHTHDVLADLKAHGVVPEWVQVGNEISPGFLLPDGGTKHWPQLTALLNAGYDAVKSVDSSTKVVIHLDGGNDSGHFRTFFDHFQAEGGKWDVIGMSYYPFWIKQGYRQSIDGLGTNMQDMVSRYNKDVIISEIGGEAAKPQETFDMIIAVQHKLKEIPGDRGLGLFYWEPEGAQVWSGYRLSCWGDDGKPTKALSAFRD